MVSLWQVRHPAAGAIRSHDGGSVTAHLGKLVEVRAIVGAGVDDGDAVQVRAFCQLDEAAIRRLAECPQLPDARGCKESVTCCTYSA